MQPFYIRALGLTSSCIFVPWVVITHPAAPAPSRQTCRLFNATHILLFVARGYGADQNAVTHNCRCLNGSLLRDYVRFPLFPTDAPIAAVVTGTTPKHWMTG